MNPKIEATASPSSSTSRPIKTMTFAEFLAAAPTVSLPTPTPTTMNTASTTSKHVRFAPKTKIRVFTRESSWQPSPPPAPAKTPTPVADPATLRTLLALVKIAIDAKPIPAPRHIRPSVEKTKRLRDDDDFDDEPKSPTPKRRKVESAASVVEGAVESSLRKIAPISPKVNSHQAASLVSIAHSDMQSQVSNEFPVSTRKEMEKIGEMEPLILSPLRRRLQPWERYVMDQYEQIEGEIQDDLRELMRAVIGNVGDVDVDDDDDEEWWDEQIV